MAMPPLYRIDAGKEIHYALDNDEREAILKRLAAQKKQVRINVVRFKGLGEMNPLQLRETTMAPDTRRLVRLDAGEGDDHLMDMLLAKKRAKDRRDWLEAGQVPIAAIPEDALQEDLS
jgi:topoisomerase-4 subunit B